MPNKRSRKGPVRAIHTKRVASDADTEALLLHRKYHGKLTVRPQVRVTPASLKLIYTPGVGAVSAYLHEHPEQVDEYTTRGRTVAVVSDGSAVLGLGNLGPESALPVMEGKAALFASCAGLNAVPIVLATQDPNEIVTAVQAIAPTFGAINLEDISAPNCFYVEERLIETLTIPVLHDDQHGTAIVVLAGLLNAFRVVKKSLHTSRVAVVGAGAAGTAIARLLVAYGVGDIVMVNTHGILHGMRTDLIPEHEALVGITNREQRVGGVLEALAGADAVVGVSVPGSFCAEHVRRMAQHPIVFALANPTPELFPADARGVGAAVVATGRSDFPNQINNALAFPGIFKGALTNHVRIITDDMKLRAAEKLAALIPRPTSAKILPTIFDARVVPTVASAIR